MITRADDLSGAIGTLALRRLDAHAKACDAGVADPVQLAAWMVRFADQDFFELDPVRYAEALGEQGLAAFRKQVLTADGKDAFAARYARERLAVLDRNLDAIVATHGGDLSGPHQFLRVAEAMSEIGRSDLTLQGTQRGIAETDGWQTGLLYDLASRTYEQIGDRLEVLRVRRAHYRRMPSASTYDALKVVAAALDEWQAERTAARSALRDQDLRAFVSALLGNGDDELAWRPPRRRRLTSTGTCGFAWPSAAG